MKNYSELTRWEIIFSLKKYFAIHELVGKWTYRIHKERAWKFFSTDLLLMLLIIREELDSPMTINNWFWGGRFSQRGLRTILQNIVRQYIKVGRLYLSGHVLGEAVDFDVEGMTAIEVRAWIVKNHELFPMKIRLENKNKGKSISWVHADVIQEEHNSDVYLFDV